MSMLALYWAVLGTFVLHIDGPMLGLCWAYVGRMLRNVLGLCCASWANVEAWWVHVGSMLGTCWACVGHMLGPCWPVLRPCWAQVWKLSRFWVTFKNAAICTHNVQLSSTEIPGRRRSQRLDHQLNPRPKWGTTMVHKQSLWNSIFYSVS